MELNKSFNDILRVVEKEVVRSITELKKKEDKPKVVHNHPPLTFLVDGCPYCQKIGNCFS